MASRAVEDAVDAYLGANWAHADVCPIFVENEQGEIPADGSAFLKLQYPVANVERSSASAQLYREQGGIRVLINVPRGAGTSLIRQYGSEIAAILRDKQFSGVRTLYPTEPFTDDESDQGLFFVGSVVVEYEFYFRD